MQHQSSDAAAETLSKQCRCARRQASPDWKFFAPLPADGRVLEIGAGLGDDTLSLSGRATSTFAIVPNLRNAMILQARFEATQSAPIDLAVVPDLASLPLESGSIDAVVVADLNASGFPVSARSFAATAAECKRILAPGGSAFLGLSNPYARLLGIRLVGSALRARHPAEPLNRAIRKAAGGSARGRLRLRPVIRCMQRAGFEPPTVYAPLPDQDRVQLVVPIMDTNVVRYCFNNLVRRNSPAVRAAIALANLAARLHAVRHLVPFYYLTFRTAPAPAG
jgi:SAM-dependent methyltransferase